MTMTHAERRLRAERLLMLARYDHYKMPPAFFAVVRALETDLAWMNHAELVERGPGGARRRAPPPRSAPPNLERP
jgi:hypothetical protein